MTDTPQLCAKCGHRNSQHNHVHGLGECYAVKPNGGICSCPLSSVGTPTETPQYNDAHGLVRNLLARLPFPDDLPAPEIVIEADGDLGFDWSVGQDVVSASLGPSGVVAFAALIDGKPTHGTFALPAWSDAFNDAMTALARVPSRPTPPDPARSESPYDLSVGKKGFRR